MLQRVSDAGRYRRLRAADAPGEVIDDSPLAEGLLRLALVMGREAAC